MRLFETDVRELKCGGCNWACSTFYGLGDSIEDARNAFEDDENYGKGLCAHCMCRLLKEEGYKVEVN